MFIRLGYVGNPITFGKDTYCKTMTLTTYRKLKDKAYFKLDQIIRNNLDMLLKVLKYNVQNNIKFYRMSQNIVPLATIIDDDFDYINPYLDKWQRIGNYIKKHNLRVDMHPDQFCVLNSINDQVIKNSIKELSYHVKIYQAMGLDSKLVLHVGGATLGKIDAKKRFIITFLSLPDELKSSIILENDDKIFTLEDTLSLCEKLHIPFVLDYLHYLCNNTKEKLDNYWERICKTWEGTGLNPKIHFSCSKSKREKRSHSDYIKYSDFKKFLNKIVKFNCDIDIMLECKSKDEALLRLERQLKLDGYKIRHGILELNNK